MDNHEVIYHEALIETSTPRQKKIRTEKQKINDAKTSERMKIWHAVKRLNKDVPLEIKPVSNVKNLINNIESKIALIK